MASVLAHNNVPARRFLTTFKAAFTTRPDTGPRGQTGNGPGSTLISTSERCFVRAGASPSQDWLLVSVPSRNDSNDLFERVLASLRRSTTSYGPPFLTRYRDPTQRSSSMAWAFQKRATTALASAPSGVAPRPPSTTARLRLTVRSPG